MAYSLALSSSPVCAQNLSLITSVDISSTDLLSSDKTGNIYVSDSKGNLYKYDPNLKDVLVYSPPKPSRIAYLDPWMGLRIFIFYKDIQEFTLVNRFLDAPSNYEINSPEVGFVLAATLSFDNKLWLIDQPSMSLLKYDYSNQQVETRRPLDRILSNPLQEILVFREYQNRIYLIDKEGTVYAFDNLGNFLFSQSLPQVDWIQFSGNDLYYGWEGHVIFVNLYSFQKGESEIVLPVVGENIKGLLRKGEHLYILTDEKLHLYNLKK